MGFILLQKKDVVWCAIILWKTSITKVFVSRGGNKKTQFFGHI